MSPRFAHERVGDDPVNPTAPNIATLKLRQLAFSNFDSFGQGGAGLLGLVGAVPTLLLFHSPFGFNAILGLIGLAGILMRNTLILVDQIWHDLAAGLTPYDAVVESTVRRSRPVILTAVAAMLAFVPLTLSSFWGSLAYVLIGGVGVGTILTLLFLPALYALWFGVKRKDTQVVTALVPTWQRLGEGVEPQL